MSARNNPARFAVVPKVESDMDVARRRLEPLGIVPVPRVALANGKPAVKAAHVKNDTALRTLALHMSAARPSSALR